MFKFISCSLFFLFLNSGHAQVIISPPEIEPIITLEEVISTLEVSSVFNSLEFQQFVCDKENPRIRSSRGLWMNSDVFIFDCSNKEQKARVLAKFKVRHGNVRLVFVKLKR